MRALRSLALRTDLLAHGAGTVVEDRGDHLVVTTSGEPAWWSGNVVIRLTPPEAPEREEARFAAAFPDASHLRIEWDDPATDPEPMRSPWAERGAEVEVDDVLARGGAPPSLSLPDGYAARPLLTDADWEASLALSLAVAVDEGFESAPHLGYLQRRIPGRRRGGEMGWWGAWHEEVLAAQMGLVQGGGFARFQNVETHPAHRRRGLAAGLLAHVGAMAWESTLVIVAEAEGAAGRVYRRAGFTLAERMVAVQRAGY